MATKEAEVIKIPKSIAFDWNGTKYTIEYDRDSVNRIERGFNVTIDDIQRGSVTAMQALFYGGFYKHHPNIKRNTLEQLYKATPHKMDLFKVLAEMYSETVETLIDEPDEGNALTWSIQ